MSIPFEERPEYILGNRTENAIGRWLRNKGYAILTVHEIQHDDNRGPRFFTSLGDLVAPDILCFTSKHTIWIECKHKSVFTWHRKTGSWNTGIDLHHYRDYKKVAAASHLPVWLLFLHCRARPDNDDLRRGCPARCPTGLFGNGIKVLQNHEHHSHPNHGRHGMVYWAPENLKKMAELWEVLPDVYPPPKEAA